MMLSRWQSTIVDAQGNVQPGARLVVFLEETQERAQVYRDRDGADPYPLGEVVANEWGYAYFYAAPDSYRITSAPLAIDWREVVVAGEWLLEAEGNAAQSAAQALLSAQSATSAASDASASEMAAAGSATAAAASESNASDSADAAQDSAGQSASSAIDSAAAALASQAAEHNAVNAKLASEMARDDSILYMTKAREWAINPENDPVEPGEFSAFHWAMQAMAAATGVPSGVVCMWWGPIDQIPSGWALCDGQNGTPNLTDRFVVAAGGEYNVGDTGDGSIPEHDHDAGLLTIETGGAHSHSASTNSTGAHTHSIARANTFGDAARVQAGSGAHTAQATSSSGAHSHTVSIGSAGNHTHTISGSTGKAGSGTEVIAKYYALAFIMKL